MAEQAVDAGLQTLFAHYSQSSSQATTRVSTPNTSPKLTLTQFLRLCQDVGLTAPRGKHLGACICMRACMLSPRGEVS